MSQQHPDPFAGHEPPPALRTRITHTLQRQGLLEPRTARLRRRAIQGGLVVGVVVLAFIAGRLQRTTPFPDARPQFLLLLYEDSTYRDDRPIRDIVAEYRGWADSLRQNHELVLSEKLGLAYAELPERADRQPAAGPTGMFIVRASDVASAQSIASSSPHLRQGGRIVVHAIDR